MSPLTGNPICEICEQELYLVDHWEYDGDRGSHEPYWECVDDELHNKEGEAK